MKPNRPELSTKWWEAVRPDGIDDRKRLEKVLSKAEKALEAHRKKPAQEKLIDKAIDALEAIPSVIVKVTREFDKRTHKDHVKGLRELSKLVDEEVARLEELRDDLADREDDDEDEESDGRLFQKGYVHKRAKMIKKGRELRFAFGLDLSTPEACTLLLHRKKSPDRLWKILKQTKRFPNRLMCFGFAIADPEDGQTLLFKLAARSKTPPSRIVRTVRKMLLLDKKMRFKRLRVVSYRGEELEDREDAEPESTDAPTGAVDLSAEREAAATYERAWESALTEVSTQVSNIRKAMASRRNDPVVAPIYEGLGDYDGMDNVRREFPDLDLAKLVAAAEQNDQILYATTLEQTAREVEEARRELTELRPLLNALDANPYGVPTNADDTVTRVLAEIAQGLGV